MKDSRPKPSIKLTPEEMAEYEKLKPLAHYDPETGQNTFGEYTSKLGAWTIKIRKKYKLAEDISFFFS